MKDYYLKDTVRAVQGIITRITTSIKYTYAATLMIFIITADCKGVLEDVKRVVEEFMKERGLKLSEEKTATTNIK